MMQNVDIAFLLMEEESMHLFSIEDGRLDDVASGANSDDQAQSMLSTKASTMLLWG